MADRLKELLAAMDNCCNPSFRLRITADATEAPLTIAHHPRTEFVGRLSHQALRSVWGSSRAIYFPTHLESFGYPLAEARVSGHPVIGLDTPQNREVASQALCGFTVGDEDSLRRSVERAVTIDISPDPVPFDPDAYFNWVLEPSGTWHTPGAIGVAQEFQRVWTAYRRETSTTAPQFTFATADRRVTCYYF
jgi:glycosyltransferase involved in cell wall biosynthesis